MRRDFGQIFEKPGHGGVYVRVRWRRHAMKRHLVSREAAKRQLAALRVRLEKGISFEDAVAETFGGSTKNRLTLRDATAVFLEHRKGRVKESTYKGDVRRLRILGKMPFSGRPLVEIQPSDFIKWSEERRRSASGATINRDLCLASALWRWAERMGYARENPLRKVPKFSEKGRARETYLTQVEARGLVSAADAVMRPFLHAALATGCRRGELLRLNWREVDFDRREVIVRPENEKAGRGRVIPMTADLHAELLAMSRARKVSALDGSDAVFLQASGERITAEVVKKGFNRALRECEAIPSEKREGVVLHSLRHSCASFMVAAGVPLLDVARILGHSTLAVTMRYAHFAPESGRAAVEKLGRALSLGLAAGPEAAAR